MSKDEIFATASTEDVIHNIYSDMLLCFYDTSGKDVELNKKLGDAWSKENGGVEFLPSLAEQGTTAIYLHGGPGQGKTTSFKVAAKMVGEATGLNVLINPGLEEEITKDNLLFISHELSGINSAIDFGGIPSKKNVNGSEYMGKLPNYHFATLSHAKASVLLLDDFANASPAIQNVALSISEEGRFQELNLGHTYVGITGNMGASDGTHSSKLSRALLSRCRNYQVEDTIDAFCDRLIKKYSDPLSDAGLLGFLRNNEDLFNPEFNNKDRGSFPCSRTWDKLAMELRKFIHINKSKYASETGGLGATSDLQREATSLVGHVAAKKLSAYYNGLLSNAIPLAEEILKDGEFKSASAKLFKSKVSDGFSSEAQEFTYQFSSALADATSAMLSKTKDEKEQARIITNYSNGLALVTSNPSSIMFSISHFMGRLTATKTLVNEQGEVPFEVKKLITTTLDKNKKLGRENMEVIVESLSGAGGFKKDIKIDEDFGMDM